VGELHPKWRQAYDLPQAPVLFELDLDAVLDTPVPSFAPCHDSRSWYATWPWWCTMPSAMTP
jgi:phenylalanyl-tRNA synthetase beta subunit